MDLDAYIEAFSRPGYSYGEWPDRRQVGLVLELPTTPALSPEADALVRDLWREGFILQSTEWPTWRGEAQRVREGGEVADHDAARRFFTVVVRTDYAMPGFLLQALKEGTVLRVLRRMRELP